MIKIISLAENTTHNPDFAAEHGLSLYIETEKEKILFDLGQSGIFAENAAKAGVDLNRIDRVIVSHGHYDHGGGLSLFTEINKTAKIYIKKEAFGDYFNSSKYIGLDKELLKTGNFVFCDNFLQLDNNMLLFSGTKGENEYSLANGSLFKKENERIVLDDFLHEQYLLINTEKNQILFTGCSHKGILNIIKEFEKFRETGKNLTVIGGFHLYLKSLDKYETPEKIKKLANALNKTNGCYYTCHCTGEKAYNLMKETMNSNLKYLSCGETVIIE